jgi:uncharacterized protein (DUF1697 family)
MTECIALLRGINVGRAKRIGMADLRAIFEDLGHEDVRTLLNSGNVLFRCSRPSTGKIAVAVQDAIARECGFSTAATVLTSTTLAAIIRENPLLRAVTDPARHLVAFGARPLLSGLRPLLAESWAPDALAIGPHAAYLWCAAGVLDSPLSQAFARHAGTDLTTRNWATVLKLGNASGALP